MSAGQAGLFNFTGWSDAGDPLVGGRLYTYTAGTTTQKTAYTDSAGAVPHTYTSDGIGGQYIALDARGELPAPLYLDSSSGDYDITMKRSDASTVWTRRTSASSISSDLASTASGKGAALVGYSPPDVSLPATTVDASLDALNMNGTQRTKTVTAADTLLNNVYGEYILVTNPTNKGGYEVRRAAHVHSGDVTSGNDIGDALISRWASISAGAGWGRWDVAMSPLAVGSGLPGAPTVAQAFQVVTGEVNPVNRHADAGAWKAETRSFPNGTGGEQMVAETQDFTGLLGPGARLGYHCNFAYMISRSPYAANIGGNAGKHARFYNGTLTHPNSIAPGGFDRFATGLRDHPTAIAVSAGGSGYVAGEMLTFSTGLSQTNNENTTVKVLTVDGGGAVLTAEIYNAGSYSSSFASPVGVTGGTGTGATFTYTLSTGGADLPRAFNGISGKWLWAIDCCVGGTSGYASFPGGGFARIPNSTGIYARNAADSADLLIAQMNSLDQVQVGGPIRLPNVANAQPTSLDWYEEGSFTPVVAGASVAGAGTYTFQSGRYTRIGNRVFYTIGLTWTAHTGTGAMILTGLPFAAIAGVARGNPAAVLFHDLTVGAGKQLCFSIDSGASTGVLTTGDVAGGAVGFVSVDATGTLNISGHYEA